jgi:putative membrane protein
MLVKKRYSVKEMILWTRWETALFFLLSSGVVIAYSNFGYTFIEVPWTPVALMGTAVAFMIGFQNNSAYDRIWEARKIWGAIVNTSRSWGMMTRDMVSNEHAVEPASEEELDNIRHVLVKRHIAWLTALRHAMRQPRQWEVFKEDKTNKEWADMIHIPEHVVTLEDDLMLYLDEEEEAYVLSKSNVAAAILYLQSSHLKKLKERGLIWGFNFIKLESVLETLFDHQGKSERIKNFPYPRQYATLGRYFVWTFILLIPFGLVPEFSRIDEHVAELYPKLAEHFVWISVPFCSLVSWVFHTMERIGRVGENPFEGSANDVPISTIARGIEIDLLQLLDTDDENMPSQFPIENNVQM